MRKASKLSYCPSSSSKSESDGKPCDAVNGLDRLIRSIPGRMPHNWKSSNLNLPPETNWWSHLQPDCGHQKGEQLNALENDQDTKMQEPRAVKNNNLPKVPKNKDMGEFWYADDHLMDLDYFNWDSEHPEKHCSDMESHWIGAEKMVPWWRVADKDELASLVSHKSLEHMENCDLPRPQNKNFGRVASACPQGFNHSKIVNSSSDQMADKAISNVADYAQASPASVSIDETQCTSGDFRGSPHGLDRPFRSTSCRNNGSKATTMDKAETLQRPGGDLSETQLLEALCHSQTRAREAEKAAQHAYDEKEHIVMLFFRQASHLFAYRQWFQILQLESLCLQLKNMDLSTSIHFPAFLPWVPSKGRQMRKGRHKAAKRKMHPRNKICKCVVAFALGFSFAGAGLVLGWTMGWFFPAL